jgi:hypothetical protein
VKLAHGICVGRRPTFHPPHRTRSLVCAASATSTPRQRRRPAPPAQARPRSHLTWLWQASRSKLRAGSLRPASGRSYGADGVLALTGLSAAAAKAPSPATFSANTSDARSEIRSIRRRSWSWTASSDSRLAAWQPAARAARAEHRAGLPAGSRAGAGGRTRQALREGCFAGPWAGHLGSSEWIPLRYD